MIKYIIQDITQHITQYGRFIVPIEAFFIIVLFLCCVRLFKKVKNLKRDKTGLKMQLTELNNHVRILHKENADLRHRNDWCEKNMHQPPKQEQKSNVIEFDLSQENQQQVNMSPVVYQYLQEANNGAFMRLFASSEKCFFRTWEEGGIRKYEFSGNVAKALANINAIFDDVCEIEGKRSGATDIENVSAGTLDSELRITSKAIIRLK